MGLRIIAAVFFAIWLTLVLLGKGGFVHLLILNALGFAAVDLMSVIRTRTYKADDQTFSRGAASED